MLPAALEVNAMQDEPATVPVEISTEPFTLPPRVG